MNMEKLEGWRGILGMSLLLMLVALPQELNAAEQEALEKALEPEGLYAVFETSLGDFACELEYDKTPVTVGNFVGLAEGKQAFLSARSHDWVKARFFDGLIFHQVIKEFIVQSGDPLGDGTGGPGYEFIDEFHEDLRHDQPGILSMANLGPGANGSQFFITLKEAPHLDDRHTVFGHVVAGMEVLQEISKQPMMGPARATPITDITLKSLRVVRVGQKAKNFDPIAAFALQEGIIEQRKREQLAKAKLFRKQLDQDQDRFTSTESGLRYMVLREGDGSVPQLGDAIMAHYIGYAENGRQFDSSYGRGAPFRFHLGQGRVIKGWDEAFQMMRVGQKCRLILPPSLAYGSRGLKRFGIPPGETLIFDVELVDVFHP